MKKKVTCLGHPLKLIIFILIISSCASDIEIDQLTEEEYNYLESDYGHAGFSSIIKGKTHYMWEKVFKDIISSDVYKKSIYSGLSNTHELGDILYKDAGSYKLYSKLEDNNFSDTDIEQIVKQGNITENASYSKSDSLSVNLLLGELSDLKILERFNADFTSMIQSHSSINVTINKYQTNDIALGTLKRIMNTDSKKRNYKNDLLAGNKYLISRLVVVKGYTIVADFNKDLSSELKVELISIAKKDSSSSNQIKFSYDGQKIIKLENNNEFVPFIQFTKAKKIRKQKG